MHCTAGRHCAFSTPWSRKQASRGRQWIHVICQAATHTRTTEQQTICGFKVCGKAAKREMLSTGEAAGTERGFEESRRQWQTGREERNHGVAETDRRRASRESIPLENQIKIIFRNYTKSSIIPLTSCSPSRPTTKAADPRNHP